MTQGEEGNDVDCWLEQAVNAIQNMALRLAHDSE